MAYSQQLGFRWPRPRWTLTDPDGKVLTKPVRFPSVAFVRAELRLEEGNPGDLPVWEPPARSGLHREAVALDWRDGRAILQWVNRQGNLWWKVRDGELTLGAVPLRAVAQELQALQKAVGLLDALRARSRLNAEKAIRDGAVRLPQEARRWVRAQAERMPTPRRWRRYYVGWASLHVHIAAKLEGALRPVTVLTPARASLVHRKAKIPVPKISLRFVPSSLAGYLWWQLYLDALGTQEPRLCPGCGDFFIPSRQDRTTCTDRCYMRAYRRSEKAPTRR